MNPYIIIIGLPLAVLLIISFLAYILGANIQAAFGLGILLSMLTIIVIHPYHFINNNLIPETGNTYVSIYIIVSVLMLIIIIVYSICKDRTNTCCFPKKEVSKFNYDIDPDTDPFNAFYKDNVLHPDYESHIEKIQRYDIVLSDDDVKLDNSGNSNDDNIFEEIPIDNQSTESESLTLGVSPAVRYLNNQGNIIKSAIKKYKKSDIINIKKNKNIDDDNSTIYSVSSTSNKQLYRPDAQRYSLPDRLWTVSSSDDENYYKR